MLKALEISGFKSFADKTRFEFPAGITVVVGPNGSGKSNIVDGIKWVLGEQSAKSLRGKDMSDVIFKGSGTGGRKMMNTAEASIIFDNSEGRLPVDGPEVHVTRRVYRSGESEYLINGQACRLKDIRDMFRGTGVGTDAYSLIEQGKVERLLQASPKDRRAIFEEAAGISRFKAKKIEAQRRLARVDQNLLRLSDIVEEVHSRLKSVRSQAGKAKRYREYSDRLQQLRTHVGMSDWRQLSEKLAAIETDLQQARDEAQQCDVEGERIESRAVEVEQEIETLNAAVHEDEVRLAEFGQRIASLEATAAHELRRGRDLENEKSRYQQQLLAVGSHSGDLQSRLQETARSCESVKSVFTEIESRLAERERSLADEDEQLLQLQAGNEARQTSFVQAMRESATSENRLSGLQKERSDAKQAAVDGEKRLAEFDETLNEYRKELAGLQGFDDKIAQQVLETKELLDQTKRELDEQRRLLARRHEEVAQTDGRFQGVRERVAVLEELQRKQEGVNESVKEILEKARNSAAERPFNEVRGIVADLIRAEIRVAAMVDVALGTKAQYLVLDGDEFIEQICNGEFSLDGRTGFIQMNAIRKKFLADAIRLDSQPGVIGRADRMVDVSREVTPLAHHLLSTTWFIENLEDAVNLSRGRGQGFRFVTEAGELIETDGTILVGPRHAAVGLVARRSELESLHDEASRLERLLDSARQEVVKLAENVSQREHEERLLDDQHRGLTQELSDHRVKFHTLTDRCEQLEKQRATVFADVNSARERITGLEENITSTQAALDSQQTTIAELKKEMAGVDEKVHEIEQRKQELSREITADKIELATTGQQLNVLQEQLTRLQHDERERSKVIAELQSHLDDCVSRHRDAERTALKASSELATVFLHRQTTTLGISEQIKGRESLHEDRSKSARELQSLRKLQKKLEDGIHQKDLAAGELRHERKTLAERMQEDYGIDLASYNAEVPEEAEESEEENREQQEIEQEIDELRRKITNIGAVNMEALNELDDLDSRYSALAEQYEDLTSAKQSLERIIHKINADSRRLFVETLDAIRANFKVLYRKAFGGGTADIVLDDSEDILECGIEIVATPPGKPSFNNSLLSGGEKALTAVSLLLAIFQFRPSPFCVLDEVDAPFDEANIGRFVDVLKGFLGWTKFVVVTHSKKTMTAATTLYGVTMQESGVSKRVAVRFEDVSEDGHISKEAIERDEADSTGGDDERGAA